MQEKLKVYDVPARFKGKASLSDATYASWIEQSLKNPESFWADRAKELLSFKQQWNKILEWDYSTPSIKWFVGAKINVCENCVDRHAEVRGGDLAIIWEGNTPGEVRKITYGELQEEVSKLANVLRSLGVAKGDRVAIYMPMVPEAAFAMLACARIGAIHSVIFAGFSAESVRQRIQDATCNVVITADEGLRGPKVIPLKTVIDEAILECPSVKKVLVYQRTKAKIPMTAGRDLWYHEEVSKASKHCLPVAMDSEDPLFILYTSGSTGKPKGVLHTQAGYLLYAAFTHRYVFDYQPGEIYFCAADVGWITGHSYIVYGPLANGATTLMFESTPLYPDAGRYWDVIQRHKVNIFYTAPTAIRSVAKEGRALPGQYDLSALRILGSVGEPINKDAWEWYFESVGDSNCMLVDTWWQTETGGILISPLPGHTKMKPSCATKPLFGIKPVIVDETGKEITGNGVTGHLCIAHPWPGQMRTVYGDHERFKKTYFSQYPGKYFTGDGCIRDEDGDYWITGRVDDVLNVAGHRLGTAEIESAIVQSGVVAEAAVVGMPHEIKGIGIYAFCILKADVSWNEETQKKIKDAVRSKLSPIATPDVVQSVPGLPKTRSGKIMRRILRKIVEGERKEFGDISTLAEPGVVEEIVRKIDQNHG